MDNQNRELTPKQIVQELDKYIIGQDRAKKSVAIALRNRWRRLQVEDELREEIMPNNIILIGPTGVGKTEIARRLALGQCTVRESGGFEIYRGGICRPRC